MVGVCARRRIPRDLVVALCIVVFALVALVVMVVLVLVVMVVVVVVVVLAVVLIVLVVVVIVVVLVVLVLHWDLHWYNKVWGCRFSAFRVVGVGLQSLLLCSSVSYGMGDSTLVI